MRTVGWGRALFVGSLLLAPSAQAQVPQLLAYHGRLTQNNGVSLTGEHTVTFRMYEAETGSGEVWEESHTVSLTVQDNGLFSAILGSLTPLDLEFNDALWLSIEIDGEGEMTPRQRLTAVGYAITANLLDGFDSSQFVRADAASTMSKQLTLTHAGTAIRLKPSAAPSVNTKVLDAQDPSGATQFSVDAEGDVTVAGNLTVNGTISGSSGAAGTVTSIDSGAGLTGGPVTSSGTLAIGAGDGIAVSADSVAVNVASGGGLVVATAGVSLLQSCANGQVLRWDAAAEIWACGDDMDTDTDSGGDITGVIAGTGLLGGGVSGEVTLNIGSGTGMIVSGDSIAVDVGPGANQIVQLDAAAKLPAVDASAATHLNAAAIASGTLSNDRLSAEVSLLEQSIESWELTDGTIAPVDTADMFLAAGAGATVVKGATSWTISATGTGGDMTAVIAGAGLTGGGTSGDATLALETPVAVGSGGTGAATISGARSNLGAAASGANTDITSLGGLTTPLSVAQGGTGAATLTAGGVLLGQGTAAVGTTGVLSKGALIVGDGAAVPALLSVGSDNALLVADSAQASGIRWAQGCMPLGGASSSSHNASFEMGVGAGSDTNGRLDDAWPSPVAGQMTSLAAYVRQAPGSGDAWTVTLRKNDANTPLACAISGPSSQSCSATGSVAFSAGDRIGVTFTEGGSASGTTGSGWSACFIPE